jgi:hypothetical protein
MPEKYLWSPFGAIHLKVKGFIEICLKIAWRNTEIFVIMTDRKGHNKFLENARLVTIARPGSYLWRVHGIMKRNLKYRVQKYSTVNFHIRILYAFFRYLGTFSFMYEKMPYLTLSGLYQVMAHFLWKSIRDGKLGSLSC